MRELRFSAAFLGSLVIAAPAAQASQTVTAATSVARPCDREISSSAADIVHTRAKARSLVSARLRSRGDWDVAIFGAEDRRVAGSAGFGGNELAEGFVRKGERLTVQACRFRGDARSAKLSIDFTKIEKSKQGRWRVVDVSTRTRNAKQRLQSLGLDLTEHGDANSVEVVLHGGATPARCVGPASPTRSGSATSRSARGEPLRDARHARATATSGLPSGRDSYRHLADYDLEMKTLAMQYPSLVRPITLNHKSVLGRDVNGIEITTDRPTRGRQADLPDDGRPPRARVAVVRAHDRVRLRPAAQLRRRRADDGAGEEDAHDHRAGGQPGRVQHLARGRAAGRLLAARLRDEAQELLVSQSTPPQYRNHTCEDNKAGRLRGTDPNRNYGGLWGGGGASVTWSDDTFRGDAPFSEPEVQNIRELVSTRQVTNLITNHTYSNLVLRPPGVADFGFPLEEPQYKALGAAMAAHNGYSNVPSFGLYDTTGATEDWTFWSTGGFGFTFEIGPSEFHPPYATGVEAEYLGLAPAAGAGNGGNREAYYEMLAATADTAYHSLIKGAAPSVRR